MQYVTVGEPAAPDSPNAKAVHFDGPQLPKPREFVAPAPKPAPTPAQAERARLEEMLALAERGLAQARLELDRLEAGIVAADRQTILVAIGAAVRNRDGDSPTPRLTSDTNLGLWRRMVQGYEAARESLRQQLASAGPA